MRISTIIKRAVQVSGARVATDYLDRRRTWSECGGRIGQLAGALSALGVKQGDRVAILSLNSDRYLESLFGIAWAGAVFVPINTRLAPPEVVYWLSDSESTVLLVDDAFVDMWQSIADALPQIRTVIHSGENETPAGMLSYEAVLAGGTAGEARDTGGDELAGLFYTGGTTGRSKGVMLSHQNLLSSAVQFGPDAGFTRETNALHAAPMFHIADNVATFGVSLMAGTHSIIPAFEPIAAMRAIEEKKANFALLVPTMINMLVNHPEIGDHDLSNLVRVIYGASPMPQAVIAKAMAVLPHTAFRQAYGQTEAAPVITTLEPEQHVLEGPGAERLKSCGRSIPGIDLRIHDTDDNEVPRGTVGEVCMRGDNVMLGYWKQPDLTAEALRNGWLHTGDGGYMDEEGYVYLVDRVKDMIISGGENVYSVEVESAIYQHPAIVECAVIGIPHEIWGEQVHAIVRCHEGESVAEEALIAHCHQLIAGFKCPKSVSFVSEPLPLSGAGKILKTELRKPFWEGQTRPSSRRRAPAEPPAPL